MSKQQALFTMALALLGLTLCAGYFALMGWLTAFVVMAVWPASGFGFWHGLASYVAVTAVIHGIKVSLKRES